MQYMVIERFRGGDPAPVYQRFRERGRMAPDGLTYAWMEHWKDIVGFEVRPVMSSAGAQQRAGA